MNMISPHVYRMERIAAMLADLANRQCDGGPSFPVEEEWPVFSDIEVSNSGVGAIFGVP
jgi:hypothetical protein